MAVFEHPSDHLFLVFLFYLLVMIYPSPKRKYGSCPGWFSLSDLRSVVGGTYHFDK